MRCKCGYISHDYNYACPSCTTNLEARRKDLGIHYNPPDPGGLSEFFGSDMAQTIIPDLGSDLAFADDGTDVADAWNLDD